MMKYLFVFTVVSITAVWTTLHFDLSEVPAFLVGIGLGNIGILVASWWDSL